MLSHQFETRQKTILSLFCSVTGPCTPVNKPIQMPQQGGGRGGRRGGGGGGRGSSSGPRGGMNKQEQQTPQHGGGSGRGGGGVGGVLKHICLPKSEDTFVPSNETVCFCNPFYVPFHSVKKSLDDPRGHGFG